MAQHPSGSRLAFGETSGPPDARALESALKLCKEVLAPLVEADGGEMYLVSATAEDIHIHLAGTCSGCPGATFTGDKILAPALQSALPKAKVKVTTGWRIPEGAKVLSVKPPSR